MPTPDDTGAGREPSPERRFLLLHGRVLVAALGHYAQAMTEAADAAQATGDQRAADHLLRDPRTHTFFNAEELARAAIRFRDAATAARAALAVLLTLQEDL